MAIQYTWQFPQNERVPLENGNVDVVKKVHFVFIAEDDTNGNTEAVAGMVELDSPQTNGPSYIPYNALNKNMIEQWVTARMNTRRWSSRVTLDELKDRMATTLNKRADPNKPIKSSFPFGE